LTTDHGKIAAKMIVKTPSLGSFLVDKLDFSWDEVHDIAEQLEHIKSEKLINKLDDFLGNPTEDPHGDPIPDANGQIVKIEKQSQNCTKTKQEFVLALKTLHPNF
jgi:DtxR family Mn-dependent transcriptional regulator